MMSERGIAKLYHGTNTYFWPQIQKHQKLLARSYLQDFSLQVEEEYGLPQGSIWDFCALESKRFEHSRHNDPHVYLTHDYRIATTFALTGATFVLDILYGALQLLRPQINWNLEETKLQGLWFWQAWKEKHGLAPVVLSFAVPLEFLPIPLQSPIQDPEKWLWAASRGELKARELNLMFPHSVPLAWMIQIRVGDIFV